MTKNLADELQRTARQALTSLHVSPQGEEPGGLPLRRLLAAVFRARYLVFATTLFGLLIGAFLAITTANSYQSTGTFLFTASGAEAKLVDPTRSTDISQETIGTAATHILNTDDLLIRVIKKLGAARILAPYQPGNADESGAKAWFYRVQRDWNASKQEATEEEALKLLRKTLNVERPRFTDVLIATFSANNARLAQEVLDCYMKEAISWHIAMYDDKRVYEDAEKTAADSKVQREVARVAMRNFLSEKAKVNDFDDEKKRLEKAYGEATMQLDKVTQELESSKLQRQQLNARLESGDIKMTRPEKRHVSPTANVQSALEKRLEDAYSELVKLEPTMRDPNDPRLVDLRNEIENTKRVIQRLQQEAENTPEQTVMVPNPEYEAMRLESNRLFTDVEKYGAQVLLMQGIVEKTRTSLNELVLLEPEYLKLRDAMFEAEEAATRAEATWGAAQQKRALGQGNFSSLKEIQAASLPLEKEGPNRGKLLLGGFFGGLFLGLAVVVLRSLPDNVVRTRDDLERLEGLAVIGIMPRLDGTNLRRHVAMREQGW